MSTHCCWFYPNFLLFFLFPGYIISTSHNPPVFIEFRVNQAIPPSFSHGFTMVFPSPLSRTTQGPHHRKPPVRARTPHCFFSTSFGRPNSLKSTGLGKKVRPVDMVISPRYIYIYTYIDMYLYIYVYVYAVCVYIYVYIWGCTGNKMVIPVFLGGVHGNILWIWSKFWDGSIHPSSFRDLPSGYLT